jgi:hypothetical protein
MLSTCGFTRQVARGPWIAGYHAPQGGSATVLADKMLKVTYGTGQIGQLQIRGVSTPQA